MAFLRVSQPGVPTLLIDIGPASGRVQASRYGTRGSTVTGAMVVGTSEADRKRRNAATFRAAHRQVKP